MHYKYTRPLFTITEFLAKENSVQNKPLERFQNFCTFHVHLPRRVVWYNIIVWPKRHQLLYYDEVQFRAQLSFLSYQFMARPGVSKGSASAKDGCTSSLEEPADPGVWWSGVGRSM